ncbi:hypothetical protein GJ496_003385 [Pomphorhynchus laevis]|nr:hypothetical protein GJ496_003385 [Pomphorhynchus laevis]
MLYLSVGMGGIGIRSPSRRAKAKYGWSHSLSRPLLDGLVGDELLLRQTRISREIKLARTKSDESVKNEITCCSDKRSNRCLTFASTIETQHDRFLSFQRKTPSGRSIPNWLSTPDPVVMRKHNVHNKYDSSTEVVQLVSSNPYDANVRCANGRECLVSVKHISPYPQTSFNEACAELTKLSQQPHIDQTRMTRDPTTTEQA